MIVVGPDGKAQNRNVTTGQRVGNLWEIAQGLRPGEKVVVEGIQKVQPGAKVQISNQQAAGKAGK